MAQIKYIGTDTDKLYNDGDQVENDILQYVKTNPDNDFQKIINADDRWPVFYHLTDMRENILNWYDFKKDADILEIGGGMGALTGILCRKAKTVTTVELTNRRAEVIFTRHAKYDNLTVLAGNFNEIEFSQKYDYITLIGVLEYAPSFTPDGEPLTFLKKIHTLLKPGGKLLIAIENRFGLKYWCGAEEDHTGKVYDGINGYPDNRSIRTFSRSELSTLLTDSGLKEQRFYYPLPDYKLPQVLYSDEYLPKGKVPNRIRRYYLNNPVLLADEGKLYQDIIQNNVFPFMANSFFVECGEKPDEGSHPVFALFTPDRKKEYRVSTIIRSDETVRKCPVYPEAMDHLKQVYEHQKLFKGNNLEKYTLKEEYLEMPFIHGGKSLEDIMYNFIQSGDVEQARTWIGRFYDQILASSELTGKGQKKVLKNGFLDLTFGNCFIKGDQFIFFDQEWMEKNIVPEYILVRAIEVLYWENPELERAIPLQSMILPYVGNLRTIEQYNKINMQTSQDVYGTDKTSLYFLDVHGGQVDLSASIKGGETAQPGPGEVVCTVYYHNENGYSEENTRRIRKIIDGMYSNAIIEEEIPIPEGCDELRIDPCEGSFCSVSNLGITCGTKSLQGIPVNGFAFHDAILFANEDPQLIVRLPQRKENRLRLGMNIRLYSAKDPLFITIRDNQTAKETELQTRLAAKERELEETSQELEDKLAAKEYEYEKTCRDMEEEYAAKEQELTANIQYMLQLCAEKDQIMINNGLN